jgi:4-amino-4-deoxy-L-arabinose transferase-like glycosyltransferase
LRPPLFAFALAGVYELSGVSSPSDRWRAGRLAEAAAGTVTVGLTAAIALELWGWAAALLAAGIGAVALPLILVGSSLMSESLFIPLVMAAALVGLRAHRRGATVRAGLTAGVLVGLAALTRSIGIVLVLPVGALLWTARPRLSRRALAAPLAVGVAAILLLVPWTVRNAVVLHAFVPISTEGGGALAGTYNPYVRARHDFPALWAPPVVPYAQVARQHPRDNEAQASSAMLHDGLHYLGAHPGYLFEVIGLSAERMVDLPGPRLSRYTAPYEGYDRGLATSSVYVFWLLGLFALGGLATAAVRRAPRAVWGVPLAVVLPTLVFDGGTRYRSPADPFVVLLAAAGLVAAGRLAVGRPRRRSTSGAVRSDPLPSAGG